MRFVAPFLDLSQAQDIAGAPGPLQDLVRSFRDSLHAELSQLAQALAEHDEAQVQHSLHSLKGFIPLFCKADMTHALVQLYQASRSQPWEATAQGCEALLPSWHTLLEEVEAWLGAL